MNIFLNISVDFCAATVNIKPMLKQESIVTNYKDVFEMNETRRLFKDGVISAEEAYSVLRGKGDLSDIHEVIRKSVGVVEDVRNWSWEFSSPLVKRTWANIVHDHMEQEAAKIFKGKREVLLYREKGFLVVDFYGKIMLRFKKLDDQLLPSNIPTEQQKAYDHQLLFGGPVTHVTAGYRLDGLGMYRDSHVVCVSHGRLLWSFKLPEKAVAVRAKSTMPLKPAGSTVVVKKTKERKATGTCEE